jgi:hypothetical protein
MTRGNTTVRLFAEDRAHEAFVRALVKRLARETALDLRVHIGIAQGGHGRAITELELYQKTKSGDPADVLAVVIDANCGGWNQSRTDIGEKVDASQAGAVVIGCPDPHVERWFLADPVSLSQALGLVVSREKRKCERGYYKRKLVNALRHAGQFVTLGGIEFAEEIVECMDLYRAGRNEPSRKHFVDDLRSAFRLRLRS